jgi:hypothetical protein
VFLDLLGKFDEGYSYRGVRKCEQTSRLFFDDNNWPLGISPATIHATLHAQPTRTHQWE